MKVRRRNYKQARIEMLPLIDTVFLLLVFFIYAMLSMAVQRSLPLDLPDSLQAAITKERQVAVSVRRGEAGVEVFVDQKRLGLRQLEERLAILADTDGDGLQVSLFAEKNISYQELYTVLDSIQASGVKAVSLQAQGEK